MKGYKTNIEQQTLDNNNFRKVLYTGQNSQLVLMTLKVGEEIGSEVHPDRDQFFRFEQGVGEVHIDDTIHKVKDGDAVVVPAGSNHNVINTSQTEPLKLYTIYSPPEHKDGVVRVTKEEAELNEAHFDGTTSE